MKQKLLLFSSACIVVATLVAPLAILFFISDEVPADTHILLLSLWCVLPLVWGLWAVFLPESWLPHRLPLWGSILGGTLGGVLVLFFDLPQLVFELSLSLPIKVLVTLFIAVVYYGLWWIVQLVYTKTAITPSTKAE